MSSLMFAAFVYAAFADLTFEEEEEGVPDQHVIFHKNVRDMTCASKQESIPYELARKILFELF